MRLLGRQTATEGGGQYSCSEMMGAAEARVQRVRGRHKQLVTDITDNLRTIPAAAYTLYCQSCDGSGDSARRDAADEKVWVG